MGRQVADNGAWGEMHQESIPTEASIGLDLFRPVAITDVQQAAIWNDPDYGLNDPNNFIRWDPLVYARDPVLYQSLQNELKIHFNLTQDQIEALK